MQAPLRDEWWTFRFLDEMPSEKDLPDDRDGDTCWADRTIRIRNGQSIRDEIHCVLHEGLHAALGRRTATPAGHRRVDNVAAFLTEALRQLYTIRRRRK